MATSIQISKEQIADFCRRHHIRRLSLFGSVLTDHFRPDSDVDVPVEFEEGHIPGMVPVKTIRSKQEVTPLILSLCRSMKSVTLNPFSIIASDNYLKKVELHKQYF